MDVSGSRSGCGCVVKRSEREAIRNIADATNANNGALLLNVGPSGGEGIIVPEQLSRLRDIGAYLRRR